MRDYRCHSSAEAIEKALTGNYRAEHLFAFEQAFALYNLYQEKASACDARIEAVLKELSYPVAVARPVRCHLHVGAYAVNRTRRLRCPRGAFRSARQGSHPDQRSRPLPRAQVDLPSGDDLSSWPTSANFTSWLCLRRAKSAGIPVRQAPLSSARRCGGNCCLTGWTDRHLAWWILQAAFGTHRQGQGNNCHGAQDRRPVLQRRASRDGIRRPRLVVLRDTIPHAAGLENLHRRAKAFGFVLLPLELKAGAAVS